MPRLRDFSDSTPHSNAPYDFELRGKSSYDFTVYRGSDQLAIVKISPGFGCEVQSDFALHVGRTTVKGLNTGDQPLRWLSIAELIDLGSPAVCIELARPEDWPIASEARLRYRLWAHQAVWALHNHDGKLVLTAHRAWRDSEANRKMVGAFRLHVPLDDKDARLTAIAASLFWPNDTALFEWLR